MDRSLSKFEDFMNSMRNQRTKDLGLPSNEELEEKSPLTEDQELIKNQVLDAIQAGNKKIIIQAILLNHMHN